MTDASAPAPVPEPQATAPEPVAPSAPVPAATDSLPAWAWPARIVGRIHGSLRASIRPDAAFVSTLPIPQPHLVALGVALGIPAVFSLLRLGVTDVYTESLAFLALAVAVGLVAPALGVLLVAAHAAFDLVRTIGGDLGFGFYSPLDIVLVVLGRIVSFYLLWLLVVEFPLIARSIPWAVMDGRRPAAIQPRRLVAAASAVLGTALMVFVWTQAAPWLVRPVFTWGPFGASPTFGAINPVQQWGVVIIVVAAAVGGAVAWLRLTRADPEHPAEVAFEEPEDYDLGEVEAEPGEGVEFVGRLATHLFAVFMLGGLVTGVLDIALLGAAALVSQPLARRILAVRPLRRLLAVIPWIVRFAVGFAMTFLVGLVVTAAVYQPVAGSEFFPLVITAAIGLLLFHVLLGVDEAEDRAAETAPTPSGGVVGAVLLALAVGLGVELAQPDTAAADNCSGLADCAGQVASSAGAAAAAATAAVIAAIGGRERQRRKRRRRRRQQDKAAEEEATDQGDSNRMPPV